MKIAQATPYTTIKQGGPSTMVPQLCERLMTKNVQVKVTTQCWERQESIQWPQGLSVDFAKTTDESTLRYSKELKSLLRHNIAACDLVHSHGLWAHLSYLAPQLSRALHKPHIVTPHGMMESWILASSPLKKKLARAFFQDKSLAQAACIHALCVPEASDLRASGFCNPIAVIPNGIRLENLATLPPKETLSEEYPEIKDKKVLLFLSRIHPKKGLLHLAEAWGTLAKDFPDWHFVIAGPDEVGQQSEIERVLDSQGVSDRTTFTGALKGDRKLAVLAAADVFALPSFSEGFSMAILEALACRIPVVLTAGCNFPESVAAGAAIEVKPDAKSTQDGLRQLLEMTDEERQDMGTKGRNLVAKDYTWDHIAEQLIEVYKWRLGGGDAPACVLTK